MGDLLGLFLWLGMGITFYLYTKKELKKQYQREKLESIERIKNWEI